MTESRKLIWNVICFVCNSNYSGVQKYNIFDDETFCHCIVEILGSEINREEFEKKLDLECFYCFESKIEWEIFVKDGTTSFGYRKVDVYNQLKLNWEVFCDYVWENTKGESKLKEKI